MNGQHCKRCRLIDRARKGAALALVAAFGIFATSGATARAASILIDNFRDPVGQEGRAIRLFNPLNPGLMEHNAIVGTILGGERELQLNVITPNPPNAFSVVAIVGDGVYGFSADAKSHVTTTLLYDGADGLDLLGMTNSLGLPNVDLTMGGTQDGFGLSFAAVDAAPGRNVIDVAVTVTSAAGTATATTTIPESSGPLTAVIPYSLFSSQAPLSAATSLQFVFNSRTPDVAVDFTLTNIATVPEPSTFALAGVGLAMLAGLIRRRHSLSTRRKPE
jgi:hypothetical protein